MAEKWYFEVDFCKYSFHKNTILLAFEAEFSESVSDIVPYPESTIGTTVVGPEEKFSK